MTAHQKFLNSLTDEERKEFRKKDCERKKLKYPYQRWKHIKRRYGLTEDDYNTILKSQNYGCAICNEVDHGKPLHIDHDHNTNIIRGLLCLRCNTMLGKARDNLQILDKAIVYLRKQRE